MNERVKAETSPQTDSSALDEYVRVPPPHHAVFMVDVSKAGARSSTKLESALLMAESFAQYASVHRRGSCAFSLYLFSSASTYEVQNDQDLARLVFYSRGLEFKAVSQLGAFVREKVSDTERAGFDSDTFPSLMWCVAHLNGQFDWNAKLAYLGRDIRFDTDIYVLTSFESQIALTPAQGEKMNLYFTAMRAEIKAVCISEQSSLPKGVEVWKNEWSQSTDELFFSQDEKGASISPKRSQSPTKGSSQGLIKGSSQGLIKGLSQSPSKGSSQSPARLARNSQASPTEVDSRPHKASPRIHFSLHLDNLGTDLVNTANKWVPFPRRVGRGVLEICGSEIQGTIYSTSGSFPTPKLRRSKNLDKYINPSGDPYAHMVTVAAVDNEEGEPEGLAGAEGSADPSVPEISEKRTLAIQYAGVAVPIEPEEYRKLKCWSPLGFPDKSDEETTISVSDSKGVGPASDASLAAPTYLGPLTRMHLIGFKSSKLVEQSLQVEGGTFFVPNTSDSQIDSTQDEAQPLYSRSERLFASLTSAMRSKDVVMFCVGRSTNNFGHVATNCLAVYPLENAWYVVRVPYAEDVRTIASTSDHHRVLANLSRDSAEYQTTWASAVENTKQKLLDGIQLLSNSVVSNGKVEAVNPVAAHMRKATLKILHEKTAAASGGKYLPAPSLSFSALNLSEPDETKTAAADEYLVRAFQGGIGGKSQPLDPTRAGIESGQTGAARENSVLPNPFGSGSVAKPSQSTKGFGANLGTIDALLADPKKLASAGSLERLPLATLKELCKKLFNISSMALLPAQKEKLVVMAREFLSK